ncbi:MAG: hypothetical protein OHK0022_40360 [Roseiflexaceae bacterium]
MRRDFPEHFMRVYLGISNKRAKIVVDHIIEHGYITTEDLTTTYGYKHPPRAVRDVRDLGIPLETFDILSSDGKRIAAYRFGDLENMVSDRLSGRRNFPKDFKKALVERYGMRCLIYQWDLEERYLQIDHRIPYTISGDVDFVNLSVEDYMLLSASANRAKSWSCEQCKNWNDYKSEEICRTCYWAYPENYNHIAMQPIRRVDIIWSDQETEIFDQAKANAEQSALSIQDYIKGLLRKYIAANRPD